MCRVLLWYMLSVFLVFVVCLCCGSVVLCFCLKCVCLLHVRFSCLMVCVCVQHMLKLEMDPLVTEVLVE